MLRQLEMPDTNPQPSPQGQSKTDYFDADFSRWLNDLLLQLHCPGISIAVVDGDQISSTSYGLARLPDVQATSQTEYLMASTTKAFTAATMGIVIHDDTCNNIPSAPDKIKWSTPVKRILPDDFMLDDSYLTENVTIEDALSHRTGCPGHDYMWGPSLGRSPEGITRRLRHLGPPNEPLRTRWQYNNLMYAVVATVIEKVTSKDFGSVLKERIWAPLGMRHTYADLEAAGDALASIEDGKLEFARGYSWIENEATTKSTRTTDEAGHYVPEPWINLAGIGAAGSIVSSVDDYAKWVAAILKASRPPEKDKQEESEDSSKPVITHNLWKELTSPRSFMYPMMSFSDVNPLPPNPHLSTTAYALGWFLDSNIFPGHVVVKHAGGLPGFGSDVSMLPSHNFGVVSVGNGGQAANTAGEAIFRELLGRKLGLPVADRRHVPKKDKSQEEKHSSDEAQGEEVVKADLSTAAVPDTTSPAPSSQPDANLAKADLEKLAGSYNHAAYGTFTVSIAPSSATYSAENPSLEDHPIKRKAPKDTKTNGDVSIPTLLVSPVGKRGLHSAFLLHSPRHTSNDTNIVIFDLEKLILRGCLADCEFTDLPSGVGTADDEKYPCRDQPIWVSEETTKAGAVVGSSGRLGLELYRTFGSEEDRMEGRQEEVEDAGSLAEGWETSKVWFEKA